MHEERTTVSKKPNLVGGPQGVYKFPALILPKMTSVPFTANNTPTRSVPNLQPTVAPAAPKLGPATNTVNQVRK
jgi:hypothetical protein